MNILLVDDDISSVTALTNLLSHDHDLKIASNGYDAFNMIAGNHYDVVITDIMMPKMNGIELLKSIREFDRDINVIVLTGYPTDNTIKAATKYNASAFFIKPIDVERFMAELEKIEQSVTSEKNKKGVRCHESG